MITDRQVAMRLNHDQRPMAFKRFEDGHMVLINQHGQKVSFCKALVERALASLSTEEAGTAQKSQERPRSKAPVSPQAKKAPAGQAAPPQPIKKGTAQP